MFLLISDANILIDLEIGQLTPALFQLPYEFTVPDLLFELELKERHSHLLDAGLKVKSLSSEAVKKTESLTAHYPRPSIIDHSALALAIEMGCPLLTGDKHLRIAAKNENVEVHGTLWMIDALLNHKLIGVHQAEASFKIMKANGSRLPWVDAERLIDRWETIMPNDSTTILQEIIK